MVIVIGESLFSAHQESVSATESVSLKVDTEGGDAGEAPIHYKGRYCDGHLTRWTRGDLDEVYLELYPAKVIVEDDDLGSVLAEAKAFMTFLAETGLLDPASDQLDGLLAHLERMDGQFRRNMGDASRYGFGKRFFLQAVATGVEPGDEEAMQSFMASFNAGPRTERDAVFGNRLPSVAAPRSPGRTTPRGTRPNPKKSSSARRRRRR